MFSPEQRALILKWAREDLPALILRGDDLPDLMSGILDDTDGTDDAVEAERPIARHS